MLAARLHILPGMAEATTAAVQLVEPGSPGAVQCKAPGCGNWFVKRSGRHVYCKTETCTYRRGAPPAAELVSPQGAAEEVLRRLQESDEAEVGPSMLADRYRRLAESLRAGDVDSYWGACCDVAAAAIWSADRVRAEDGGMPLPAARPVARREQQSTTQRPVGLVHAVLASHHRTYVLGDQRVALVYELMDAREHAAQCELAVSQVQGRPDEEAARETHRASRLRLENAERALQSVEAAWRERGTSLEQLEQAAAVSQPPGPGSNGGARRGQAAAGARS